MNCRDTLRINAQGHLEIGGMDTVQLVKEFGTPLYVMDEEHIRKMCSIYRQTIEKEYNGNGLVLYASKALSCLAIYKIVEQESLGIDVVSGGELYTALKAGFPTDKIYMHGNNKLVTELQMAIENKIACIVVDNFTELDILDALCQQYGVQQNILLRINPGVEAHTHQYIQTAKVDSKFGFAISNGSAEQFTQYALTKKNLNLQGYHCHIGSQIFERDSFALATDIMLQFIADMKEKYQFEASVLNLGGGYGIWYTDEDVKTNINCYAEYVKTIITQLRKKAKEYNVKEPFLLIEPGRSIVGEAGITLYTVGNIKEIANLKKYIAIDGGMFENPRYALYQAKYTACIANRANDKATEIVSLAGKCCESGDFICEDIPLAKANIGDIIAVFSTGAYNYAMSSNYNRNLVPPIVLVKKGRAAYIVKPQTFEDIIRNDVLPEYLK